VSLEAPVATSAKSAALFPSKGDRVSHGTYGPGTITDLDVYHTVIEFDGNGIRRFVTGRVQLERTTVAGPSEEERRVTALRRTKEERARKRAAAAAVAAED
jgi:hypothetical protein